ncbi:MAG: FG-GAP repeat domain-containing protein [Planctomycetota bacterium]
MRVGDTNGDGFDDITYSSSASFFTPTYVSNGDRTFSQAPCGTGTCTPILDLDYELVDMNGDGRADVVTPERILLAKPSGMFTNSQFIGSDHVPFAVGVGDFDGDGLDDVAVGRNGTTTKTDPGQTLGDVVVYRGLGDGTVDLAGVTVSHVAQPRWIEVADVDGDGRQDVVAARFQDQANTLSALLNHTYGPGSPWLDLGHALAGSNGTPIMLAEGTLIAGEPYSIALANGLPGGLGKLFVGLAPIHAPFKQGVMVPRPDVFFGPVPLDVSGGVAFGGVFPPGASGATIWMQWWLPEAGGPVGWAASSGVQAQVP